MPPWAQLILLFSLFWVVVYGLHYLFTTKNDSFLPLHSRSRRATKVTLQHLHLRVETAVWNASHDWLTSALKYSRHRNTLTWFYDLGSGLGVLGMIVAIGFLWLTASQMGLALVKNTAHSSLSKRDMDSYQSMIHPIIPGLTVPLSHLPLILLAVFSSQIIHEAGHAFAAALESIPVLFSGVSVLAIIPSAFVSLPSASLDVISPRARLRIIAAGPFHNLVFWCFLLAVGGLGVGELSAFIAAYRDVSAYGVVVTGVEFDSPLYEHIPIGGIITKLDDTSMGSKSDTRIQKSDAWTEYLTGPAVEPSLGWCVSNEVHKVGMQNSQSCCSQQGNSSLACFQTLDVPTEASCLDPASILTNTKSNTRCNLIDDCPGQFVCARPRSGSSLLRITVTPGGSEREEIILWSGPRKEVWEQVKVGRYTSIGLWFLPLWLPGTVEMIYDYLQMATLSLFFFNLLPIHLLDGEQLLHTLLDIIFDSGPEQMHGDLELGSSPTRSWVPIHTSRTRGRWKRRVERVVQGGTIMLLAGCTIFAMFMN